MSESNITKRAYAGALRELMKTTPFEKITVAQICEKYGMSRNSFYYHFKDKFDLVAWIFDEEYVDLVNNRSFTPWGFMEVLCGYLYDNRDFYRKVLKDQGQNSFSEHFEEFIYPLMQNQLHVECGCENIPPICIDFMADGFICSIRRWLLEKNCMTAEQFVSVFKTLVENIVVGYSRQTKAGKDKKESAI